jgi:hypothetical protein
MIPSLGSVDPLLLSVVLITLAIGLPIVFVLAIRFLWDRNLALGRSKELEKLIWQLHRIASALELEKGLSFPAVQPGTEEPRDIVYLQQPAAAAAPAAAPVTQQTNAAQAQPDASQPVRQPVGQQPASGETRHAGVNSMFGF